MAETETEGTAADKTVIMRVVRYAETDNGDGRVTQEVQLSPTHRDGRPINADLQTATAHFAEFVEPASLADNRLRGGGYVEVTMRAVEDPQDAVRRSENTPGDPPPAHGGTPVTQTTVAQPGMTHNPDAATGQ